MIEPRNISPRLILGMIFGLIIVPLLVLFLLKGSCTSPFHRQTKMQVVVSTGTVKEGDTMSSLLIEKGLPPNVVANIQSTIGKAFDLRRMIPGHKFEVVTSTNGIFQEFTYHDTATHSYIITRSSDNIFSSTQTVQPTVWRERVVTAEVGEFLYRDLLNQQFPESFVAWLIADLADNIFAWRIDFFTEQRPGDKVAVLLEQQYVEDQDKPLYGGRILAATYNGRGTRQKENYAIRYRVPGSNRDDFFDLEGKAVRKAFLRAPFTYGAFRVSSSYNPRRFHPILRIHRPHHGTDYAAASGTPVVSVGKGMVEYAGWRGEYGNCVFVKHSSKFTSRYGHLSRVFVRTGQSVHQGQHIGNVGSTGLSTGPHLHFEMLVDNVKRNFLRLDFPAASSVPKDHLADFTRVRDDLMARLNRGVEILTKNAVEARSSGSDDPSAPTKTRSN